MVRLLVLLFALGFAADAHAATVTYEPAPPQDPRDHGPGGTSWVRVKAAPGERNVMTLSREDSAPVVRDSGAPLVAGRGCQARADGSVRCPAGELYVDAGDGGDHVVAHGGGIVLGGPGDDVLEADGREIAGLYGGDGDDVLRGQGTLFGGGGDDRLTGSAGGDELGGGPGADTIDAGAGADTLTFTDSRTGVVVDLAAPVQADGDVVSGIEDVRGSPQDDRISGDAGPNRLEGREGDDVLAGRGGGDELSGDEGVDRVSGGSGDDNAIGERVDGGRGDDGLAFDDRVAGSVRCGPGDDTVTAPPARTPIRPDCEHVMPARVYDLPDVYVGHPRLGRRAVSFALRRAPYSPACRVRITVRSRGDTLGVASTGVTHIERRVRVRLSRPAHDVQVSFRATFACRRGHAAASVTQFRLRQV
jgi:RTX calcium-binding nonapeptide repeat (4 copies)